MLAHGSQSTSMTSNAALSGVGSIGGQGLLVQQPTNLSKSCWPVSSDLMLNSTNTLAKARMASPGSQLRGETRPNPTRDRDERPRISKIMTNTPTFPRPPKLDQGPFIPPIARIGRSHLLSLGRDRRSAPARARRCIRGCSRAQAVYRPRAPDESVVFQLLQRHWSAFEESCASPDGDDLRLPDFVRKEADRFRRCGGPEFGFIRLRCEACHSEYVLPFACKSRVVCSSCAARRMHDRAAHLMAHVFPDAPVPQWVLSPPSELVPLLAVRPKVLTAFVRSFVDAVTTETKARLGSGASESLNTGAVAFMQRFTKTLGLFPHVQVVFVDGVYVEADDFGRRTHRMRRWCSRWGGACSRGSSDA